MEEHISDDESRRKRVKLSASADDQTLSAPTVAAPEPEPQPEPVVVNSAEDAQALKEAEVGITEFVCPDIPGFSGILKKR